MVWRPAHHFLELFGSLRRRADLCGITAFVDPKHPVEFFLAARDRVFWHHKPAWRHHGHLKRHIFGECRPNSDLFLVSRSWSSGDLCLACQLLLLAERGRFITYVPCHTPTGVMHEVARNAAR